MRPWSLAIAALCALIPLTFAGVSAAPKNDHAITESSKKPGKSCDNLTRGSADYKQCIQTQAHIGQTDKDKGKGKGQSKKP